MSTPSSGVVEERPDVEAIGGQLNPDEVVSREFGERWVFLHHLCDYGRDRTRH
jgi:hypothetical protein